MTTFPITRFPWPYAALAYVKHQHDAPGNRVRIYVIFPLPMDLDVKPNLNLWVAKLDYVIKPIVSSTWQGHWQLYLRINDIVAPPGQLTLDYLGPSPDLRTTWAKQWEPWSTILSIDVTT